MSGSTPTPTLQVRELRVDKCELCAIRGFVERYHYSRSVNGVKTSVCFAVRHAGRLVGAVIYGELSTDAWVKFADRESAVLELRRLVLIDAAPRNSESRVIGLTLRWIRLFMPGVSAVVSYADPEHGHDGVIYRASNFVYLGQGAGDVRLVDVETGRSYHSRALRTTYRGAYKPFVQRLRERHAAGLLVPVKTAGKHGYIYRFGEKHV